LADDEEIRLGATGDFPDGKINETDEGGLRIAVGKEESGRIVVHFGKPTAWIGFDDESATRFAASILQCAGVDEVQINTGQVGSKEDPPNIGELVQVNETLPHWFRCIVTVDEIKPWGIQGFVTMPEAPNRRAGDAYIRLEWREFIRLGALNQYVVGPTGEKPDGDNTQAAKREGD
jgi:hypothetical protein